MLAIVLCVFGIVCGFVAMLVTGLPLVLLRVFRVLPFDRRLWWAFAAIVAYFLVRDMILASYDYAPPTASPDKFYFGIHIGSGTAGVIGGFALGLMLLFFLGKPSADQSIYKPIAIPSAIIVLVIGSSVAAMCSRPTGEKRAAYVQRRLEIATAIKTSDAEALSQLLTRGSNLGSAFEELDGLGALDYAIQQEDVAILRVLLDPPRGKPPRIRAVRLQEILKKGNRELFEVFLEGSQRNQRLGAALRATVSNGDRETFDYLLEQGALPNAQTDFATPLLLCAEHNRIEMARELIKCGADVNGLHGSPDLNRGATPLITAIDHQHQDFAQLLLENGADVNKTVSGKRSALQAACRVGDVVVVDLLVKAGADVNYVSKSANQSGLHWTLAKPHRYDAKPLSEETKVRIIKTLLNAGANRDLKDRNGNTASDLAGHGELEEVLEALKR